MDRRATLISVSPSQTPCSENYKTMDKGPVCRTVWLFTSQRALVPAWWQWYGCVTDLLRVAVEWEAAGNWTQDIQLQVLVPHPDHYAAEPLVEKCSCSRHLVGQVRFNSATSSIAQVPSSSTLRLDPTRHVQRVELVVTSVSSCAVRQAWHSQNAWARHVERVVSCLDMKWRDDPNGIWACVCLLMSVKLAPVHQSSYTICEIHWRKNFSRCLHLTTFFLITIAIQHGDLVSLILVTSLHREHSITGLTDAIDKKATVS